MESNSAPVAIEHEYFTGPEFVSRLTGAVLRLLLGRPISIVILSLVGLALVISLATWATGADSLILVFFFAFILVLWPLTLLVTIRRRFAKAIPPGTRFALGIGENSIAIQGPLANSEVRYAAYKSVSRRGEFVVLRTRQGTNYSFLPVQLLPGDAFDRLSAGIARVTP
jgi:hypothetical protein